MRYARIEDWSRRDSPLHRCHAAAKILVTLALLIPIAVSAAATTYVLYFVLLLLIGLASRLPIAALLRTAAGVLPFALCFALVTAFTGERQLAAHLIIRSYLSALATLLLIATTPMPDLIAGMEWLRAPRFLMQVMQFLYRYLIVLMEEAVSMTQAGTARAGTLRGLQFRQAAAAAGVLFARAYSRAEAIHRAMLARGFEGRMPRFRASKFTLTEALMVAGAGALAVAVLRIA